MSSMIDDFFKEPEHTMLEAELVKKSVFKIRFSDGSIKQLIASYT